MTPLTYTDAATARRYVDVVASLSRLGEDPAYLGREMLLSNYSGVEPTLTSLDAVADALDRVEEAAARLRAELDAGLDELGYRGPLERQVGAWLAATSMTGDAVIEFGRGILDRARADTIAKVTALPDGEGVDAFTGVRSVFYGGPSKYTGDYRGWLHFNVDKQWQRDVFVQVPCHEAYPGHPTFYALWDQLFRTGRWPIEAAFYTRNAPTNPTFEGGPEVAMHLVGWDVGDSAEARGLRLGQAYKDLGRIAMNDACLGVNAGVMTRAVNGVVFDPETDRQRRARGRHDGRHVRPRRVPGRARPRRGPHDGGHRPAPLPRPRGVRAENDRGFLVSDNFLVTPEGAVRLSPHHAERYHLDLDA